MQPYISSKMKESFLKRDIPIELQLKTDFDTYFLGNFQKCSEYILPVA